MPLVPARYRLEHISAAALVGGGMVVGVIVGLVFSFFVRTQAAVLFGWDCVAAIYLIWVWTAVRTMDPPETATFAARQDPSRPVADLVVIVAGVAMLGALGLDLLQAKNAQGGTKAYLIGGGMLSVVLSWALIHTVFTLRYARAYFAAPEGGIDFNEDDPPVFMDFAYFAFTIGMTFQVSDTDIKRQSIRRLALHHALLAFLFGAVLLAVAINVVASIL